MASYTCPLKYLKWQKRMNWNSQGTRKDSLNQPWRAQNLWRLMFYLKNLWEFCIPRQRNTNNAFSLPNFHTISNLLFFKHMIGKFSKSRLRCKGTSFLYYKLVAFIWLLNSCRSNICSWITFKEKHFTLIIIITAVT